MSYTFPVNDVSKKETWYKPEQELVELPKAYKGLGKFEAFGGPQKVIRSHGPQHGLWRACENAYNGHRRLVLSPDHIWLAIARIAAEHITSQAEELRSKFVDFDGKKTLEIRRDEFVKGSTDNDWPGAFDEFATQIDKNVKTEVTSAFATDFSTTGPVEKAAGRIVFMDAMSHYFRFEMQTLCGIPEITILGEPQDWERLVRKVVWLQENLKMGDWLDKVEAFVGQFYFASAGDPNTEWWQSFYRNLGGSGGEHFDGYLRVLFPEKKNGKLVVPGQVWDSKIPNFFSRVPVLWKYYAQEFKMRFVAGIPFATVLEDGAITPAASWAIEELP